MLKAHIQSLSVSMSHASTRRPKFLGLRFYQTLDEWLTQLINCRSRYIWRARVRRGCNISDAVDSAIQQDLLQHTWA